MRAATEDVNAIQRGRLYLIAHIGELLRAAPRGGKPDRGKILDDRKLPFNKNTLSNYRKVAGYKAAIDSHFESRDDDEPVSVENTAIPHAAL